MRPDSRSLINLSLDFHLLVEEIQRGGHDGRPSLEALAVQVGIARRVADAAAEAQAFLSQFTKRLDALQREQLAALRTTASDSSNKQRRNV